MMTYVYSPRLEVWGCTLKVINVNSRIWGSKGCAPGEDVPVDRAADQSADMIKGQRPET